MKQILAALLAVSLTACTTNMYVAKTSFDDGDMQCAAQAYWYKTDYLFGSKADRVLTVTTGGARTAVQYQERDGRLIYLGEASRDNKIYGDTPQGREFVCGQVIGMSELKQFEGDRLALDMHCAAKLDELSLSKGYLPAREEPYAFSVSRETLFSFTGELPEAPRPPTCSKRDRINE